MFKIKTLNKISENGLQAIKNGNYSISDDEQNPNGILLRSFDMHSYDFNDELFAIGRAGAGVNNIPLDRCSENGIVVFNTPGANANAVKELVICSLLLGSRKIAEGIAWTSTVEDKENIAKITEKEKANFKGNEILGKKLGVIGLGAIGVLCANSAAALGMEVIGYDPYISVNSAWNLRTDVTKANNIDEIFEQCDYITLHVPYMESTKNTINKEVLAKCKDGVVILNFARGELVNNTDILEAVKNKKVARYIVDFPKPELIGVDNILTIPHLGASTDEAEENCALMAVAQVKDYLENGNITNSVNLPNVNLPFKADSRICIINKNAPKIVGSITSIIADAGLNIEDMINKSRDEFAYTIIDIKGNVTDAIIDQIKNIDGVNRVRVLTK